jgi:hypothetical protein
MSYSKEKTPEFTSESAVLNPSSQTNFLETAVAPNPAKTDQGEVKPPAYSLGFKLVAGLSLAALLFVAAIYYGMINP